MKVYNYKHDNLTENLNKTLIFVRKMRGFNAQEYIDAKTKFLNEYLSQSNLSACVIAISGGIDSAAVLSLLAKASQKENSPIKKIIAITLPALNTDGATNQLNTIKKANTLCDNLGIELQTFEVNKSFEQIFPQIETSLKQEKPDNWARGQLVAYARTPFLYYTTSVLTSQNISAIIVGTTNRDEGAYLGYVGKASDGMVDIQLISDLHKSEVYSVSKLLNVPSEILNATPTGDMFDGRSDEDVFGAPYDFVELFLNFKNISENTWKNISYFWNNEDKMQFKQYSDALEKLHKYNNHKYWSGSQAIHLDIIDSAVDGGWISGVHSTPYKNTNKTIVSTHKFVGFIDNPPKLYDFSSNMEVINVSSEISVIKELITTNEINELLIWKYLHSDKMIKTNEYGRIDNKSSGSKRLSFYSDDFAKILSERISLSGAIHNLNAFSEKDNTNWAPYQTWRFIGVNPMVRLIEYETNDFLIPHYDDSFYQSNKIRSLFTLVIILNNDCVGGSTRFLFDTQNKIDFNLRNFSDWNNEPTNKSIENSLKPKNGNALLFPHRLLHDGERIISGNKIILRTEIMFEACSSLLIGK
jgi:NAD+ synthetase